MTNFRINRLLAYSLKTGKNVMLMKQMKNYTGTASIESLTLNKPDEILMSAKGYKYAVFRVNLNKGNGKPHKTYLSSYGHVIHGPDGTAIAAVDYGGYSDYYMKIFRLDGKDRTEVFHIDVPKDDDLPYAVYGLGDDAASLVLRGKTAATVGLKKLSLETGEMSDVELSGRPVGDVNARFDRYTGRAVGVVYTDDLDREIYFDKELEGVHAGLKQALPGQNIQLLSWTADRSVFTFSANAPGVPAAFYLFDKAAGEVSPLGSVAPHLAERPLGKVSKIEYAASDGKKIPAYLTLPAGKTRADGPFPLILMPHGGPKARDDASYDWWAQAYAAEGYAVLQPNFRGSDGYGFAFRDAGYGELGGKMVTDVLDGGKYLESQNIAKRDGWCVVGASYGGYSALMSGLINKQKTRCIVAVSAVTDFYGLTGSEGLARDEDDFWARYLGGTIYQSTSEKRKTTPAERTDEYDMPVLLIHGREDTTVPVNQSRGFKKSWGSRPGLRYVEIEGEDHYLGSSKVREKVLSESIAFLAANHPAR